MRMHVVTTLLLLVCALWASDNLDDHKQAITIDADLTHTAEGIIHSHMIIPVTSNQLSLAYPRWTPGQHSPKGPINEIINLRFSNSTKTLKWQRDEVDMYLFHVTVPEGAQNVEVDLDFASSKLDDSFSVAAGATQEMAVVNWNQLLMYPADQSKNQVSFTARLHLPMNWHFGTSLPASQETPGLVEFKTVPLITLIDSPVIMGEHFRVVPLGGERPAEMDVAAESEDALQMSAGQKKQLENLVREATMLFGGAHYERYHFLVALSDPLAGADTLEHLASSENRMPEQFFRDKTLFVTSAVLIPH